MNQNKINIKTKLNTCYHFLHDCIAQVFFNPVFEVYRPSFIAQHTIILYLQFLLLRLMVVI